MKKRTATQIKNGTYGKNVGFSKISQELFWKIYKKLSDNLKNKTYFTKLNKEFDHYKKYFYDFVISNIKICIEYNGEYVHPNKEKLTEDEKYEYDQIKLNALRKRGFEILIVWDSEYKKDPEKVLQECLNFILQNSRRK